jgi:hypothetical protein
MAALPTLLVNSSPSVPSFSRDFLANPRLRQFFTATGILEGPLRGGLTSVQHSPQCLLLSPSCRAVVKAASLLFAHQPLQKALLGC